MKFSNFPRCIPLFFLFPLASQSQQVSAPSFTTPEAKAFQKFIDFPVANFTGVPGISVPLFTISLKNFEWPFSLSYHAGGITVNEVASEVGLGWTLSGKGIISANYIQGPDYSETNEGNNVRRLLNVNGSGGNLLACSYQNSTDMTIAGLASDALAGNYMPDVYYLNLGQRAYKFFLGDGGGYTMPASPIQISLYSNLSNSKWTITDEQGNTYRFDSAAGVSSVTSCGFYPSGGGSTFYLTKITTANNENIQFIYNDYSYSYTADKKQAVFKKVAGSTGSPCNTTQFSLPASENCDEISYVTEKRLSRVNFPSGYALFYYTSRSDISGAYKLDEINLYSNANELIKKIRLVNSYFGPTSGATADQKRLKLEKLQEIASGADTIQYQFVYNSTELPSRFSFARDFKNYYNGRTNNLSLIPYNANGPTPYNYADRDPDSNYVKACTLEKIIYPSGGNQTFDYCINLNSNGTLNSGLRVRKITLDDNVTGVKNVREYEYASPQGEHPQFNSSQDVYFLWYPNQTMEDQGCAEVATCTYLKFSSYPMNDETYWNPMFYYDTIIEKYSANGVSGKVLYEYTGIGSFQPVVFDITFIDPQLIRKSVYKNNAGTYQLLTKEEYGYKLVKDDTSGFFDDSGYDLEHRVWGLPVTKVSEELNDGVSNMGCASCFPSIYWVGQRRLVSAPFQLIYKKSYQYEGGNVLFDSMNYEYGTNYNSYFVTKERSISSKNETLLTEYKYPAQFAGQAVYDAMLARNMASFPIEQIKTNSTLSKAILKVKTNYALWQSNQLIAPQSIEQKIGDYDQEVIQTVYAYDRRGDLLSFSKSNDIRNTYIWDYDTTYPVAQCVNADTASIAYTSFEAGGKGNWSFTGSVSTDATSPTGEKAYSLSGGSITKTSLNSSGNYIVSYWSKNGQQTVSGSGTVITGRTIGSWTYYEHPVPNPSGGTITVSGIGTIDELRLYPKDAMMTTYTYEPLIGMTSQCDANNHISYYEYDGFGRLVLIRDQNKNIIKKICYNYAGQTENCN